MTTNLQYKAKRRKISLPKLPTNIQLKILACLEIDDLLMSCLLVSKQWKAAILSPEFARRQYRHNSMWATRWRPFSKERSVLWGPYKILNVRLHQPQYETCSDEGKRCTMQIAYAKSCCDRGIVCMTRLDVQNFFIVGNPIKNDWKVIPPPSQGFHVACMNVDTSTSTSSFKIVAISSEGVDLLSPSMLHTEIFDSTMNTWNKGNKVLLDGHFEDKLEGSLIAIGPYYDTTMEYTLLHDRWSVKRIIAYNFEDDRWSVKSYVSPQDYEKERIILCKEGPILISYSGSWVTLWKEHSCCKGIINWSLMAKLDVNTFLAQHKLKIDLEVKDSSHHCMGHVIIVMVHLFYKRTALLNYDMRKGCWELGGSMRGWPRCIDMKFAPSLITI